MMCSGNLLQDVLREARCMGYTHCAWRSVSPTGEIGASDDEKSIHQEIAAQEDWEEEDARRGWDYYLLRIRGGVVYIEWIGPEPSPDSDDEGLYRLFLTRASRMI